MTVDQSGPRRKRPFGPATAWRAIQVVGRGIVVLSLGLAGCVPHPAALPTPAGTPRPSFILTFWCGPPLPEFTRARAEQIAAAGFNVVGAPCAGGTNLAANLRALDIAARSHLQLWVADSRFAADAPDKADWQAQLDAAVADYKQRPAFGAYFIGDEPGVADFDEVAKVVARLRAEDPAHLAYVNLYPQFVDAKYLGTADYQDYVDRFIKTVQPQLLSYDYYPFLEGDDRSSFFENLTTIRDAAREHHLPFLLIVQAMPHWKYRDPTEAELSWQVFHALAFGARGISYFAYWTPPESRIGKKMHFHYGLMEDGKPTLHYYQAAALNRTVARLARQLDGYDNFAVADSESEIGVGFPLGPIAALDGGPLTAGMFGDVHGDLAVLLVNRDYRYGVEALMQLTEGNGFPERFDPLTDRWHSPSSLTFPLPPGGAILLRWQAARR